MSEPEPTDLRISDAERESAMTALGEHMSAGRLNIDEYGERSAQVTAAKTRGELTKLFADLPGPHPVLGGAPAAAPAPMPAETASAPVPVRTGASAVKQRIMAAAVPLAVIISCILVFVVHTGWVGWLLIPAVTMGGGALFGNDWHERQRERHEGRRELQRERNDEYRERQRERRDRRRGSGY